MSDSAQIKLYETRTIVKETLFTGSGVSSFTVITGSRMLITLLVTSIDLGATLTLTANNTFDSDEADDPILVFTATTAGRIKKVLSDFHNQFDFSYTVTGGNATFKVGISLYDNAMTTRIDNAIVQVDLHHTVDSNGNFDSVRIGDGTDLLDIDPSGAIPVIPQEASDEIPFNEFNESLLVVNGAETTILTYTVPPGMTAFLSRIDVSGENIARYEVYVDAELIARKRTWFGQGLNESFDLTLSSRRGLSVQSGGTVLVKVLHGRSFAATFEARLQGLLKG